MMKRVMLFCLCFLILLAGCASGGRSKVERMETEETKDLSGKWNDTDSRLVSEEMIKDVLAAGWLNKFKNAHKGKSPVVIVGSVRNLSHEHIAVGTFVKDLERALINSGEVEFVASKSERDEIREERLDQASHATEATAKGSGEEVGADFMLQGTLNSILDKIEGKAVMYYQANLELIEIKTHKKVWIGEKKIKKFIQRRRLGL